MIAPILIGFFRVGSALLIYRTVKLKMFFGSLLWADDHRQQDACTGVHSAYRREKNGRNLDICVLRRLRLTQRQMQEFLVLNLGGGSSFANMGFKSST